MIGLPAVAATSSPPSAAGGGAAPAPGGAASLTATIAPANPVKPGDWILCNTSSNFYYKVSSVTQTSTGKTEVTTNVKIDNDKKLVNKTNSSFDFDSMKCEIITDTTLIEHLNDLVKNSSP